MEKERMRMNSGNRGTKTIKEVILPPPKIPELKDIID